MAAVASADFFATVFPNNDGRPPQLDLSIAAEDAWRTPIPNTKLLEKYDGDWWTNAFSSAFSDTLEAHRTSGVDAQPIVAVLSGPREPGGLAVTWSADQKLLARSASEGAAQLWSIASGRPVGVTTTSSVESAAAISPDGSHVAVVRGNVDASRPGRLVIRKVLDGTEQVLVTKEAPLSVSWSPDGTGIAVRSKFAVTIFDVVNLAEGQRWALQNEGLVDPPLSMAWSPDSTRVAYTDNLAGAVVRNVATGAVLATFLGERPSVKSTTTPRIYMVRSLAWAADGQRIVSVGDGDGLIVWSASTGAPFNVRRGESGADAQWLTADRVLVKARFTEQRSTWDLGRKAWTSTLPGFAFDAMAISPDGQFVATSRPYFVVIRKLR